MQRVESWNRVHVLSVLIYSCYVRRSLQYSLREVRGHRLLEPHLHLELTGTCQAFPSIKTNGTDLADDDAFYVFCASVSSHPHLPKPPRPRPRRL